VGGGGATKGVGETPGKSNFKTKKQNELAQDVFQPGLWIDAQSQGSVTHEGTLSAEDKFSVWYHTEVRMCEK